MLRNMQKSITLLALAIILVGAGFAVGNSVGIGQAQSDLVLPAEQMFADIYNRVSPSVVAIITAANVGEDGEDFFAEGSGSGFVIDQQGHIVTNFHVVDGADRIEVYMFDGTIAEAQVIGLDPDSDIAVIRINVPTDRLVPVPLGDSGQLTVGQTVLALGNPFANNWTLTSGIVSALDRTIFGLNNYSIGGVIQTDAAINPGNSGGPLLNLRGEVVGVNAQIESNTRQNSGVGFAVPSNLVKRVIGELIANGSVNYSFIGINSRPIDLDLIQEYNLPNNIRGVAVRQVVPGSPASESGLRTIGTNSIDVIIAINGQPLRDFAELVGYLAINTAPGETVQLTVYRDGQEIPISVTLSDRP